MTNAPALYLRIVSRYAIIETTKEKGGESMSKPAIAVVLAVAEVVLTVAKIVLKK